MGYRQASRDKVARGWISSVTTDLHDLGSQLIGGVRELVKSLPALN